MFKNTIKASYKGLIIEPAIVNFAAGRILTKVNTPFPQAKIETYIKYRLFHIKPAIEITTKLFRKHYKCGRCLNDQQSKFIHFDCAKCDQICTYCRHCIAMGRIISCANLIAWNGPQPHISKNHEMCWDGTFTKLQARASQELSDSIAAKRQHLIHAVCGAGKTEILFTAIYKALKKGLRICVATPRTDVVLELFPRFQKVFPNTILHALYGGGPEQKGYPQLVLATTHQLYRFEHAFDVMIVDEADAFPYTFDSALQKAVQKAKKPNAPVAYVTATPSEKLLAYKEGYSFIPKRYHNFPLPVPRFSSLWNYEKQIKKEQLPTKLMEWTKQRLASEEPFLIFFPTIDLLEKAMPLFQKLHASITSVHAEDVNRKEKVMQLRNAEIPGLLTTTILERGITIKNVQVAVVGAESSIFTASALIQIAGRVGRNAHFHGGDIVFYHHGITTEMDSAKEEIENLNELGFGGEL
ncbi:DEAD/DEAH box helicase family protein [Solibacillus sp. CAU 1738]|uniref:DEAD/DEAH box helicase n=1 Tax=Solibacillus sp. CAU 1738 TaxID=3140363 RepID=UPI003260DD11